MPATAMEMALSASVELAGDTSRPEPRKGRNAARQGYRIIGSVSISAVEQSQQFFCRPDVIK